MPQITVGANEKCSTIQAALDSTSITEPLEIFVKNGVYREKLFIEREYIKIVGESANKTIITYDDGAYDTNKDGDKNGTFRSYTMWLAGNFACAENITIENTCGDGEIRGQGIALAVSATRACFKNLVVRACQDTLFTAPLPLRPRVSDGFKGPLENKLREKSEQIYAGCTVQGDIDFVFGGADAYFSRCSFIGNSRGKDVNGFFAAPCTPENGKGYLFHKCSFSCESPQSYFLARPWRKYARATYIECLYNSALKMQRFDNWGNADNENTVNFWEYACESQWPFEESFAKHITSENAENVLSSFVEMSREIAKTAQHYALDDRLYK